MFGFPLIPSFPPDPFLLTVWSSSGWVPRHARKILAYLPSKVVKSVARWILFTFQAGAGSPRKTNTAMLHFQSEKSWRSPALAGWLTYWASEVNNLGRTIGRMSTSGRGNTGPATGLMGVTSCNLHCWNNLIAIFLYNTCWCYCNDHNLLLL